MLNLKFGFGCFGLWGKGKASLEGFFELCNRERCVMLKVSLTQFLSSVCARLVIQFFGDKYYELC